MFETHEKIQGIEDTWLENSTLLFSCLENEIFLEEEGGEERRRATLPKLAIFTTSVEC